VTSGRALAVVVSTILAIGSAAYAQPGDTGFIGREALALEIDDCRPNDPARSQDQLKALASEHYRRGETLYVQGDYEGAVTELVSAYCVVPYYVVLKDIGQAYERSLDYEKAIAYLERYVAAIPPDAKPASSCTPDPQDDKANVERRVTVLKKLPSRVQVETTPPGAVITIANETGRAALARSGDQIRIQGGSYELTVEREGYVPVTRKIQVQIGKPYTYYVKLEPLKGTLTVQVTPPDARVFLGDRLVGIGRYTDKLAGGEYLLIAEAPGRERYERTIEVLPNQSQRESVELAPLPQTGRRQLVIASAIGGGIATGSLLYAFQQTSVAGAGTIVGGAAGLFGSYFALPENTALGTSNLTITSAITGAVAGFVGSRVFTDRDEINQPMMGAGLLLGGGAGYYLGRRLEVTPGEAALFGSAVLWGTTTGTLFAISFDPSRPIASGLVLSGLGMGGIGGVLLTRYFEIGRTHAVLIDLGGLVGIIGDLAGESLAHPNTTDPDGGRDSERSANFALGGMALGLVTAGILTRNMDVPKLPVQPALGTATSSDGKTTTTYGVTGTW
jgi:tetratricopeptide (TPR) repeat protein